jgi:hypothetical protein
VDESMLVEAESIFCNENFPTVVGVAGRTFFLPSLGNIATAISKNT